MEDFGDSQTAQDVDRTLRRHEDGGTADDMMRMLAAIRKIQLENDTHLVAIRNATQHTGQDGDGVVDVDDDDNQNENWDFTPPSSVASTPGK
jgi:hypothetical protein